MSAIPPSPTDHVSPAVGAAGAPLPPAGPFAAPGAPSPERVAAAVAARAATAQQPTAPLPVVPDGTDVYAPRLAREPEPCASCGALLATDQRYCLACGERRAGLRVPFPTAPPPQVSTAPAPLAAPPQPAVRRRGALPANAVAALYGLAGAAALGIGLLAGALIVRGGDDDPAAPPAAVASATPTPPPAASTPPPATAAATFTPDWPAGQTGWTVQLQTLPKDGTTPEQIASAKNQAVAQGAADVGALDSDQFASLDPGSYVIYSTIGTTEADAQATLDAIQANFPGATLIEVSDQPADDGGSTPAPSPSSTPTPTPTPKAPPKTPEEAQKEIRKAPSEVESEGTPPPEDDADPGAGSEATEIG